jgi:hypothetical protein
MEFLLTLIVETLKLPSQVAVIPAVMAQNTTPAPLIATANGAGLVFKNVFEAEAGNLNAGTVIQRRITSESLYRENGIEYVDNCGKDKRAIGRAHITDNTTTYVSSKAVGPYLTGRVEVRAWFVSAQTPPAPGLRVVLRNASISEIVATMPYTDREYDQGNRSESFIAALGDQHKSRFLALRTGGNRLIYEIKREHKVIESGEFVANIDMDFQDVSRSQTISRPKESLHCEPIGEHEPHKRQRKH